MGPLPAPSWSDGARPLEEALGDVVLGVEDALADLRQAHEEGVARKQAEEAARLEKEEQARRAEYSRLLAKDLTDMADRWAEAARVEAFIAAVEKTLVDRSERSERWLRWARAWLDDHDPLRKPESIPKVTEPWKDTPEGRTSSRPEGSTR